MLFRRFYQFVTMLVALVVICVIGFAFCAVNVGRLGAFAGERVFYLDDASSQGVRKENLSIFDIFRVEGESVRFARTEETEGELVASICERYGAKKLFSESVCGVTSYYCYVPTWQNGVDLNGITVNLHIALAEKTCTVGTPVIFDGF